MVCITFNKNNQITFADGQRVKIVDETIYLGMQINKRVDPKIEINRRISSTMPILKRLDLFWKQARVPTKWKMNVFNAVCVSKLLYSLEALHPKEAAVSKLDTFQLNGLRKILHMHTTYIDRANTNNEVYRRANLEMGSGPGAEEIIRPLCDIRRTLNHPQHQATFATRNLSPQQVENRRVGRPRAEWTHEAMKDCWRRKFPNIPFQIQNREHREQIKTWHQQGRSCLTSCSGANGSHPDLLFVKHVFIFGIYTVCFSWSKICILFVENVLYIILVICVHFKIEIFDTRIWGIFFGVLGWWLT